MITAKPTENLAGVTIEGTFDDLYEITESIYRITGLDDNYDDPYWGIKNRLLGVCYDIRHAYMGTREIRLVDNNIVESFPKSYPRREVRYSVNIMFTEAVFVALSVSEMYLCSGKYYGKRSMKQKLGESYSPLRYADYVRDRAVLDTLAAVILGALAEAIGDDEVEKLLMIQGRKYGFFFLDYATMYLDKCNIEYLKAPVEKRKDKLKNIAKRFLQQPDSYRNMKRDLEYSAKLEGCSVHELYDPRLEYPEEINW